VDDRTREVLPLVAWLVSLAMAIAAFTAMGSGQLAAPSLTDPGTWGDWAADRDAVVATVAVLRLVVLALAWYLVGVTTVGAIARVARWARLVRVTDTLSVPVVRRVLRASLGVGLATTVVVSSTGATVPVSGPTTARAAGQTASVDDGPTMHPPAPDQLPGMRPVEPAPSAASLQADATTEDTIAHDSPSDDPIDDMAAHDEAAPPTGMRPLPADTPTADATTTDAATTEAAPPDAPPRHATPPDTAAPAPRDTPVDAPAPSHVAPADDLVTLVEGDHLWAVAERHLAGLHGGDVSDEVVGDYWRRLIDVNRGRLVDPDDPDLVFPGQRFVLPVTNHAEGTP
jgi:hypothetical protein